jgi:hypothetical protein
MTTETTEAKSIEEIAREAVAPKPCPFCGEDPSVDKVGDGDLATMIQCVADDCVGPHVSYYGDGVALALWNRRATNGS